MKVTLDYIPDGFRHIKLSKNVDCDNQALLEREGDCFVGRVREFDAADRSFLNHIHLHQQKYYVQPGDIIPLILAYRRSIMEVSSTKIRYFFRAGDTATILGGDGYAGTYQCVLDSYGKPVMVELIGAITDPGTGEPYNIRNHLPAIPETVSCHQPFVIAVVGTRMDSGKSTTITQLSRQLAERGLSIVAGKVTGFGCLYETRALSDGVTVDFTDFGLPSTCGDQHDKVIETADRIVDYLKHQQSDVIILEFGGGVIDPYRVTDVMAHLRDQIDFTVFVAFDLCGVKGGRAQLQEVGCDINFVSGPLANTSLGVEMIGQFHGLEAESNQGEMTRSGAMIENLICEFAAKKQ